MNQRKLSILADHIEAALYEDGRCRRVRDITQTVNQTTAHRYRKPYQNQTVAKALVSDSRFRWTGKGTYGLAEWNVGLSNPPKTPGTRHTITLEINYLMSNRDAMPMQQMLEHFANRFTVHATSVQQAVQQHPTLEISEGNVVKRPAHARGTRAERQQINPALLRQTRRQAGMKQHELATAASLAKTNVSKYEGGLLKPTATQLQNLAQVLGVDPEDLLAKPAKKDELDRTTPAPRTPAPRTPAIKEKPMITPGRHIEIKATVAADGTMLVQQTGDFDRKDLLYLITNLTGRLTTTERTTERTTEHTNESWDESVMRMLHEAGVSMTTEKCKNGKYLSNTGRGDWIQEEPDTQLGHPSCAIGSTIEESKYKLLSMLHGNILKVYTEKKGYTHTVDMRCLREQNPRRRAIEAAADRPESDRG